MGWSAPNIFYKHALANLVPSSTDATGDFDVAYLLNRLEIDFWQAAGITVPCYITADAGEGNTITADYLTISGHNLNTIGATLDLQFSDGATSENDLVTNGAFTTDTTGWTPVGSTGLASVAGGESGNCLEITNDPFSAGVAYQEISGLTIGETYKLKVHFKKGTAGEGEISIGITINFAYYASKIVKDDTWTAHELSFTALETVAVIALGSKNETTAKTSYFDTVTMFILDWTDASTAAPLNDLTLVKTFTSQTKRYWRLKITGTLSAAPSMAICYWGEAVSLGLVSSSFDPHTEEKHADVIVSHHGYLQEVDEQWTERAFTLNFSKSNDPLYQKIKDLWDTVGLLNFVTQWEPTDHAEDIWLMRIKNKKFENLLVEKGLYRDIPLQLTGRKEI